MDVARRGVWLRPLYRFRGRCCLHVCRQASARHHSSEAVFGPGTDRLVSAQCGIVVAAPPKHVSYRHSAQERLPSCEAASGPEKERRRPSGRGAPFGAGGARRRHRALVEAPGDGRQMRPMAPAALATYGSKIWPRRPTGSTSRSRRRPPDRSSTHGWRRTSRRRSVSATTSWAR